MIIIFELSSLQFARWLVMCINIIGLGPNNQIIYKHTSLLGAQSLTAYSFKHMYLTSRVYAYVHNDPGNLLVGHFEIKI